MKSRRAEAKTGGIEAMIHDQEEVEVEVHETGFTASKTIFISNNGVISGSSLVDVKVGTVGGRTERKNISVGDSIRYDAGEKGTFDILLLSLKENSARFLVTRIA